MTFVDVLWSLFHLLKGMSVRMEHATASSASPDAVELRMQRHCEMMRDDARWCCRAAEFFVTELC